MKIINDLNLQFKEYRLTRSTIYNRIHYRDFKHFNGSSPRANRIYFNFISNILIKKIAFVGDMGLRSFAQVLMCVYVATRVVPVFRSSCLLAAHSRRVHICDCLCRRSASSSWSICQTVTMPFPQGFKPHNGQSCLA